MENIEAIIFDLGGVILDIDYNLTRTAFEKLGIENFNEMYSQSTADDLFRRLETGKISEENFYKEINERTGLSLSEKEINGAWNAMLLKFREKSLEHIEALALKYRLFLLSNTNHIHLKEFIKIYNNNKRSRHFKDFFEIVYCSCEMGLRKPDAVCYERVIEENNLVPEQTLFIDDSVQNVEAAKLAGMQAILLKPGMFIEELGL